MEKDILKKATACKVFSVHRSSYKYCSKRPTSIDPKKVSELIMVKAIHEESKGSAGARTISTIATARGLALSRYRVSRLMKVLNLHSCQLPKQKYKRSGNERINIPNYLNGRFDVTTPNQVWCGDVTYIWVNNRWAYLAIVMDLYARKPIGWAMSYSPNSNLTAQALPMAFESRG